MAATEKELVRVMEQHRARMLRMARRRSRNAEDAEDAVQEAFLAAFRHREQYDGRAQLSSWLTRIVINAASDRVRWNRARPALPLPEGAEARFRDATPSPEDLCYRGQRMESLQRMLRQLPKPWQHTVLARELEGLSTRETAERLGVAEGTVKSNLFRAHRQLRRHLAPSSI